MTSGWIIVVVILSYTISIFPIVSDAHEDYQPLIQPDLLESDCVTQWKQMGTYFFQDFEESKQNRPLAFEQTPSILFVNLSVQVGHFESHYVDFNTRSYNGKIPAPTIKVCPGDKLIIRIKNTLAEGDLNVTNIHLHGLHVSPEGHADNVLSNILPGKERVYEYNIRNDHPSGTFWYHPHSHGVVNTQLSGMMAGALIIADRPGNFPHELAQMDDLVMVIQAICLEKCHTKFDDLVEALTIFYSKKKDTHYRQISTEFPVDLEIEDTGSPLNDTSLLHVYVNGQYQPEIHMKPNEFKRFRYINAIANNLVEIIVPKCEMFLLGMDGIYRKHPIQKEIIVLAPGGRMDVAIKCPHEGAYFVETQADPKRNHLLGQKHRVSSQKIISLRVIGGVLAQEQMVLPRELPQRPLYMTDLLDVKKISRHYDYEFSVWTFANRSMEFGVNQMPFDKSFVNHTLKMDEPEEWTLSTKMYGHCIHTMDQLGTSSIDTGSESADQSSSSSSSHCHHMNHPFHIHGTHYQITNKMLDFDPDNILYELGEWRDTIPLYDTHVRIRFTPRRHMLGNIMTHCHVASHADAGMAQLVQVVQ